MKKLLSLFILLFTVQIYAQQRPVNTKNRQSASVAAKSATSKITQFLTKETGYTKVSENIWLVPYQGKSLPKIDVMIFTMPETELVVMAVDIVKNKNLRLSQDLLYTILKYNDAADQVKAGIDRDGDLFLRAEISGRLMDSQEFKNVLEQVAAAADQLHGQISGSITSAP